MTKLENNDNRKKYVLLTGRLYFLVNLANIELMTHIFDLLCNLISNRDHIKLDFLEYLPIVIAILIIFDHQI
jgi:hypothetical protein